MDDLEALLRVSASENEPAAEWQILNTSTVVSVSAVSSAVFPAATEAFDEARRMLTELLATDYVLVNRAQFGVKCEAYGSDPKGWHGTLDVCLRRKSELTSGHTLIAGS